MARKYRFDAGESDNESEADEPINERPCNRGRRKKNKRVKKKVEDDWSIGSDEDEDDDDEIIDDFKEDDSGVDMADSLVGSQFSLLATGKPLKVDDPYHRRCCLTWWSVHILMLLLLLLCVLHLLVAFTQVVNIALLYQL